MQLCRLANGINMLRHEFTPLWLHSFPCSLILTTNQTSTSSTSTSAFVILISFPHAQPHSNPRSKDPAIPFAQPSSPRGNVPSSNPHPLYLATNRSHKPVTLSLCRFRLSISLFSFFPSPFLLAPSSQLRRTSHPLSPCMARAMWANFPYPRTLGVVLRGITQRTKLLEGGCRYIVTDGPTVSIR